MPSQPFRGHSWNPYRLITVRLARRRKGGGGRGRKKKKKEKETVNCAVSGLDVVVQAFFKCSPFQGNKFGMGWGQWKPVRPTRPRTWLVKKPFLGEALRERRWHGWLILLSYNFPLPCQFSTGQHGATTMWQEARSTLHHLGYVC